MLYNLSAMRSFFSPTNTVAKSTLVRALAQYPGDTTWTRRGSLPASDQDCLRALARHSRHLVRPMNVLVNSCERARGFCPPVRNGSLVSQATFAHFNCENKEVQRTFYARRFRNATLSFEGL